MTYHIVCNTAGYLPESEPYEVDSWDDAVAAARSEVEHTLETLEGYQLADAYEVEPAAFYRLTHPTKLDHIVEIVKGSVL